MQASSPGTHAEPQMVHALVHARQASCPSTRTGSTGDLAHMGQLAKIDAFQLPTARLTSAGRGGFRCGPDWCRSEQKNEH